MMTFDLKKAQDEVRADLRFGLDSAEFGPGKLCALIRWVAAMHHILSRAEFVEACVAEGINKDTAAIQFRKSRAVCATMGNEFDKDGRSLC